MKILLLCTALFFAVNSNAQTVIFQDDFESGSGNWTFSGTGTNGWVVNNAYAGYPSLIPDTPPQPGSFNGGTQSNYMHIMNSDVCSFLSVCNANFDTGSTSNSTASSISISTAGMSNVSLDFWYLCVGQPGSAQGAVSYSLDGGITWTNLAQYSGVNSWTQETITNPSFDGVADLRIQFSWINSNAGADPAFSVDQIVVSSSLATSNSLTTVDDVAPGSWCEGTQTTLSVNYTSTGTWNPANNFNVELSDETGSFASPTVIGSVASTMSSGSIPATAPGSLVAGGAYRVRVVATDPATTGTDNSTDLIINALPSVSQSAISDVCVNGGAINLVGGTPGGGTYSGTGVSGGMFDPTITGLGTHTVDYTITSGSGCTNTASTTITVVDAPTVTLASYSNVCADASSFALTGGSPAGGTYSGTGVTGGMFDPLVAGAGTHDVTYTYTDANNCNGTATQTLTVESCAGIGENNIVSIVIAPNPTTDVFTITSEQEVKEVLVYDLQGKLIQTTHSNTVDVSGVSAGRYLVKVILENAVSNSAIVVQ